MKPAGSDQGQDLLTKALDEANKKLKEMPTPSKPKDEVNFDDISSDSSDEEEDNKDDKSVESVTSEEKYSIEERLTRAESSKATGNTFFKENNNIKAREFYQKGLNVLEKLEDNDDLTDAAKEKYINLLVSLNLNKAATCNRQKEYKDAVKACDKVLKKVGKNEAYQASYIKALLRRGVAFFRQNDITEAKRDLMEVIRIDKNNKDAIRELKKLKTVLIDQKKRAKATFGDIFKKDINMYKDKEDEIKKKALLKKKETARKRKLYEEEKEKSEDSDNFASFDDWIKAKEEKEREEKKKKEEEREKREKEREEKRRKKREEERKKKLAQGIDPDADEVELDEEDLAAIADVKKKGYCHFRREKTEDEEQLLSHIAPSKIEDSAESLEHLSTKESEHSAWNNAKTWEERDVSDKVKEDLKAQLKEISLKNNNKTCNVSIYTEKVSSVTGDCQVVFVSGKKGTVYDMSVELKFKAVIVDDDDKEKKLSGKLKFPEIANGTKEHNFEATSSITRLDSVNEEGKTALRKLYTQYEETVRELIFQLVEGQYKGTT